jgi:2-polyprenyl-6-methoxyphenol hydroxylase-like FAD-dependent oxidoreductase
VNRKTLDVGVIGCGTAGGAAALFLARAGHRVTVYERVEDPGPVGAGIMLQPTGQAVLGALGMRDEVVDRGARVDRLRCVTRTGRSVIDIAYRDLDPDLYGVGLHRGVLFASLFAAVKREPIDLRLGVAADDLARTRGGTFVVDTAGTRHGPHDLVVIADGARSRLRRDADLGASIAEYEWGALWCVAEDPDEHFHSELFQTVDGNQKMFGLLPTGVGPGEGAATPLVSIFWSIRGDRVAAWRDAGLDAWKKDALSLAPRAEPLLATVTSPEQMLYATYHHVAMNRWNTHDVVYLGDAAHAMSPQLGQGCNLALFDAWTLAECIADHESLATALRAYSAARHDHLRLYQLATRWLTPLFQSDLAVLGALRDVVMGAMGRVPALNRVMAASMAGILTGPFGRVKLPRH